MVNNKMVIKQEFRDADVSFRDSIRNLQEAYKRLSELKEFSMPISIREVNKDFFLSQVRERKNLVSSDLSLTENEKQERIGRWHGISIMATKQANIICDILSKYPTATWKFDETINNYYCTNIEEVVTALVEREIPAEAYEHRKLFEVIVENVKALREWEKKHDVKTIELCKLYHLPEDAFFEIWCTGAIKNDNRFAHLGIYQHCADRLVF